MRAERGALTAAPALSGHGVFGKTVIVRAIAKSACVETIVNAGPNHLIEDEILSVAACKNFCDRHVSGSKNLYVTRRYKARQEQLEPLSLL